MTDRFAPQTQFDVSASPLAFLTLMGRHGNVSVTETLELFPLWSMMLRFQLC